MDTATTRHAADRHSGLLYPLMVIAAIAVIVFSVAGIATMMGWMPSALSRSESQARVAAPQAQPQPETTQPPATQRRTTRTAAAACKDCGVIESIRAVESKGEGTGLGAVAGGVVGGILGNQVGRGNGRTAATVVGAGAGAYAGHEIEKNAKSVTNYQVRVRMQDGTYRTYEQSQPVWSVGQKVRVTDQGIVAAS